MPTKRDTRGPQNFIYPEETLGCALKKVPKQTKWIIEKGFYQPLTIKEEDDTAVVATPQKKKLDSYYFSQVKRRSTGTERGKTGD